MCIDIYKYNIYKYIFLHQKHPLAIAQLVERWTVVVQMKSIGHWFDSGSRDYNILVSAAILPLCRQLGVFCSRNAAPTAQPSGTATGSSGNFGSAISFFLVGRSGPFKTCTEAKTYVNSNTNLIIFSSIAVVTSVRHPSLTAVCKNSHKCP